MKSRKIMVLLIVLTMCISSVNAAFAADKFKFEETFDFTFAQTTGQGVAISDNWRSKSTDEGAMYNSNNGSEKDPWFKVENGNLYLNTGKPRNPGDSMATRWNGQDIPQTPAVVYKGDHATLTANQEIKAQIVKTHFTDSFGIGFQMSADGKNGYIIAFGDQYAVGFSGGNDATAYYIIKIKNGNYSLLKEVKVSDIDKKYIPSGVVANIDIVYEDGKISFTANAGDIVLQDSVTDSTPLNIAGNDGTVWIMAAGVSNSGRYIYVKEVSIGSYGTSAQSGEDESGDFKYNFKKEFDNEGKLISDTCTITGLSSNPVTKTDSNWNLVVPDVIDGHTVTKIAADAFKNDSKIFSIEFTGTHVTEIGNNAFRSTAIRSCHLPEGLTKLGINAFRGCSRLHDIVLPSTLKSIPSGVCTVMAGDWNTSNGNIIITIKADDISFEAPADYSNYFEINKNSYEFYVANKSVKDKIASKVTTNGGTYSCYYIDADKLKYSDGKVSLVPSKATSNGKLIVAGYDADNRLLSADKFDLSVSEGVKALKEIDTKYTDGTYNSVKVMFIDNFDDLTPVAEYVIIPQ